MGRFIILAAVFASALLMDVGCASPQLVTEKASPLTRPAIRAGDSLVYDTVVRSPAYLVTERSVFHIRSFANGRIEYRVDEKGQEVQVKAPAHTVRRFFQSLSGQCSPTGTCDTAGFVNVGWIVYFPGVFGSVPKDLSLGSTWARSYDKRPSAWNRLKRDLYCKIYACSAEWGADDAGTITTRVTALDAHVITLLVDETNFKYPRDKNKPVSHYTRSYELHYRDGLLEAANLNPAVSKGRWGWTYKRVLKSLQNRVQIEILLRGVRPAEISPHAGQLHGTPTFVIAEER